MLRALFILSYLACGMQVILTATIPLANQVCPDNFYSNGTCTACGKCALDSICNKESGACPSGCQANYKGILCTTCADGRFGSDCSPCSENCQNIATCEKMSGSCTCKPGFKTPNCRQPCDSGLYGQNCASKCSRNCVNITSCDKYTGHCACRPGFQPPTCDRVCEDGKYDVNCSKSCGHCQNSVPCDKEKGECPCQPGYQPPYCFQVCEDGKYGVNCSQRCGHCQNSVPCDKEKGECPCQPGYQPPYCFQDCQPGKYGLNCTNKCGECASGKFCDRITGNCTRCSDNMKMPLCNECIPGRWGLTCAQRCGQCGSDGTCHKSTGECANASCMDGWTTSKCDRKCPAGTYGQSCTQTCGHCKNNSTCRHDNGICELECEEGYDGILCKSEKKELVGPVVGAILGAGLIIAISTVSTLLFLKHFQLFKSSLLNATARSKVTEDVTSTESNESNLQILNSAVTTDEPSIDPSQLANYDKVAFVANTGDIHDYEAHRPTANADHAPLNEPIYQNALPAVN